MTQKTSGAPGGPGQQGRATSIKSTPGTLQGGPYLALVYIQTDAGTTRKSA